MSLQHQQGWPLSPPEHTQQQHHPQHHNRLHHHHNNDHHHRTNTTSSTSGGPTNNSRAPDLRHSSSGASGSSNSGGIGGGGANRPVSGSGLKGLFGRRSKSQQYQDLPHRPIDPQAPRLPKVYLSPPASPELLAQATVPAGSMNGSTTGSPPSRHYGSSNYAASSKAASMASSVVPPMPPLPDATSQRNPNRHSVTSTAASLSPRMRRRRRDPTPFNILVIGFLGTGKTSFIRFLKASLGDSKRIRNVSQLANEEAAEGNVEEDLTLPPHKTNGFVRHYLEKEVDGERVGLTIFDSEGFGPREQNIVDLQLTLLINFITGKFEETFAEVSPRTYIHCILMTFV